MDATLRDGRAELAPNCRQVLARHYLAPHDAITQSPTCCEAPLAFYLEPFFSCLFTAFVGAIGASALGLPWWVSAAVTPAAWFGIEALFLAAKGCGLSWRAPVAAGCREFMIPALWVQALTTTRVYWGDLPLDVPRRRAA